MPPVTIPFARKEAYRNPEYTRAMADLMIQKSQEDARLRLARGQSVSNAWGQFGNVVMSSLTDIAQKRELDAKIAREQAQQQIENTMRQQEMAERKADRQADIAWRQKQYETEESRYRDTIGDREADATPLDVPISPEAWSRIEKTPAAGRFRTTPGQPAMPAWEAEPVGDAMADAGPATPAMPATRMRNPTPQESLALRNAQLAEQDRAEATRRYTIEQGQELAREREQRRQFEVTNARLSEDDGRNPTTASLAFAAAKGDVTAQKALDIVRKMDAGGRSPQQVQNFMTLSGQYQKSPLVAAADRTIILGDAIKAVRADPNSAPAQTQLAYSFVQALDTYQSAVREGELKNISLIDSAVGRWGNEIEGIVNQKRLVSAATAKSIADTSERMIKAIEDGKQAKAADFGRRAKVAGIGDMWKEYFDQAAPTEIEQDFFQSIRGLEPSAPTFGPQQPYQPFKFTRPGGS